MALGDIWRLTLKGVIGADDNQNVLHYRVVGGGGTQPEDAESLADAWATDALNEYLACLSVVYQIQTLSVRGVTHPTFGFDRTVTGNGTITGEVAPTQTSALINYRTAQFGRSFQGKQYLPALAESAVSNGSITPTEVALIDTYVAAQLLIVSTTLPLTTFALGVYSRELLQINNVTTHFVSSFAATQRRRRPGVGS